MLGDEKRKKKNKKTKQNTTLRRLCEKWQKMTNQNKQFLEKHKQIYCF